MGRRERKEQEKLVMKDLIVDAAMNVIKQKGLNFLTLRNVAKEIEYSPATIYEYFANKQELIKALSSKICRRLYEELKAVEETDDKEIYFTDLMKKTMRFHLQHPHSVDLLTSFCFSSDPLNIPDEFEACVKFYAKNLKLLKYKRLTTKAQLDEALDILRAFLAGSFLLIAATPSERTQKILENAVKTLLRGWAY